VTKSLTAESDNPVKATTRFVLLICCKCKETLKITFRRDKKTTKKGKRKKDRGGESRKVKNN